jgi:hypothetical protein
VFRLLGACVWHDVGLRFHGIFTPRFGVDGLTAFFLGMLGLVAAPTSRMRRATSTGRGAAGRTRVLTGAFVLVLAEVLCARDPISFLAGWELMTLLPAAIILVSRSDDEARRPSSSISRSPIWRARVPGSPCCCRRLGAFRSSGAVAQGSGLQIAIARCSRGHGHQGGVDADAQLAPACAPDRTGTGVGVDERRG